MIGSYQSSPVVKDSERWEAISTADMLYYLVSLPTSFKLHLPACKGGIPALPYLSSVVKCWKKIVRDFGRGMSLIAVID